jgi:hypothetical protein
MSREEVVQHFVDGPEFIAKTAGDMKDFMLSLGSDDVLAPGAGGSVLSGGALSDTFMFNAEDDGTHVVTDLEAWDFIALDDFGYGSIAVARSHLSQVGEDVVFNDQGVTVTFEDTTLAEITNDQILI